MGKGNSFRLVPCASELSAWSQAMGFGFGKASDYMNTKFGRGGTPDLAVDLPGGGSNKIPKVYTGNLNISGHTKPDINVRSSVAYAPSIGSVKATPDFPSARQVAANSAAGVDGSGYSNSEKSFLMGTSRQSLVDRGITKVYDIFQRMDDRDTHFGTYKYEDYHEKAINQFKPFEGSQ